MKKAAGNHTHVHPSKMYVRYAQGKSVSFPGNFEVYPGSVYGRFQDSKGTTVFWICENFQKAAQGYQILFSDGKSGWYQTHAKKGTQIYQWISFAIKKLGFVPTVEKSHERVNYAQLMRTYSQHKKGTGSRINTRQINNPLQWREVTENAHWTAQGNASVVANNMRYEVG